LRRDGAESADDTIPAMPALIPLRMKTSNLIRPTRRTAEPGGFFIPPTAYASRRRSFAEDRTTDDQHDHHYSMEEIWMPNRRRDFFEISLKQVSGKAIGKNVIAGGSVLLVDWRRGNPPENAERASVTINGCIGDWCKQTIHQTAQQPDPQRNPQRTATPPRRCV